MTQINKDILKDLVNEMHHSNAQENIGRTAIKRSKKRFKSKLYQQVIKDVTINPHNKRFAYIFVEDETPVDCDKCEIVK